MLLEKDIVQILGILRDASASDDEIERAGKLFAAHEAEIRAYLRKKFHEDSSAGIPIRSKDRENAYGRLQQRLFAGGAKKRVWFGSFNRVAAILIIVIGTAVIASLLGKAPEIKSSPALVLATRLPQPQKLFDTLRNDNSQTAEYKLPDSSSVKLEPQSYCFYERGLSADKKVVYLNGAAVFNVKRDKNRPFSVYVKGIEVRDLGTIFSICSASRTIRVKLIKGKVLIHSLDAAKKWKDIVMIPDQVFSWDTSKSDYALTLPVSNKKGGNHPVDIKSLLIDSGIVFQTTSLNKVLDSIGKKTGVSIVYNPQELAGKSFTGTVVAGQTLESLIYKICLLNDLHYHIQKNKVFIRLSK